MAKVPVGRILREARRGAHRYTSLPGGARGKRLAWLAQLLGDELDPDFVLTNVMIYWPSGPARRRRWSTYDHGGHFAAHKVSDVYVADVRAFFRAIPR